MMVDRVLSPKRRGLGRLAGAFRKAAAVAAAVLISGCAATDAGEAFRAYAEAQQQEGRFRSERAPADAPFDAATLLRNFELVAFVPERQLAEFYARDGGGRLLSRWRGPVSYRLVGDGVRRGDRRRVGRLAERLSRLTGLGFTEVGSSDRSARISIFLFGPETRRTLARRSARNRSFNGSVFQAWATGARLPCFAVFNATTPQGGEILSASIYIASEIEEPLRTACFTEELTQTLGLFFDHPTVRPSIFNDDQEFIALTTHDEALLRILYDPSLRPGMTAAQASIAARRILGLPSPGVRP